MQSIVAYTVSTESHFGMGDPSKRNYFLFLLEQTNCGLKLDSASESPRVADYVTKALDPRNYTCAWPALSVTRTVFEDKAECFKCGIVRMP